MNTIVDIDPKHLVRDFRDGNLPETWTWTLNANKKRRQYELLGWDVDALDRILDGDFHRAWYSRNLDRANVATGTGLAVGLVVADDGRIMVVSVMEDKGMR